MPLAKSLARRYARASTPVEDLIQVASLGLLKAIDRFDGERGTLQSFAIPTILGELRRYFRDTGWGVHVPRGAQELALSVSECRDRLTNGTGQAPTVDQLAEAMSLDAEQVLEALQVLHAYDTVPLDAPSSADQEAGALIDALGTEEVGFSRVENRSLLGSALQCLTPRDQEILRLRFVEERTQTEIAERVGISQMQVSRLLRGSLEALRIAIEDRPVAGPG
jgi:RNA polymerase sigma-B factor